MQSLQKLNAKPQLVAILYLKRQEKSNIKLKKKKTKTFIIQLIFKIREVPTKHYCKLQNVLCLS